MSKTLNRLICACLPRSWSRFLYNLKYLNAHAEERQGLQRFKELASHNFQCQLAWRYGGATGLSRRDVLVSQEFKVFSQNGEDGLLLHIFSKVGAPHRTFVEFGIGTGEECNTANLTLSFGWAGLLMDGASAGVAQARAFYARHLGPQASRVRIEECFVSTENIDRILRDCGVVGEVDLLSVDIDGNDYWVWKAMEVIRPRVVVIEYNASLGSERSITIPYRHDFQVLAAHPSGYYHGASLGALSKLGRAKGYLLVACESHGMNAFFVREDVARGHFEAIPVADAYYPHAWRLKHKTADEQYAVIRELPFESV